MKKVLTSLMAAVLFAGYAYGASTVESYSAVQLVEEINEALADPTSDTLTVTGKSTLGGELEINGAAGVTLDINAVTNANLITIDQTAVAGPGSKPFIAVTDARTGTSADTADEASVVLTAAGAYGLSVADGIVNIEGEIDATGDITLDPGGDDLIVDGTIDATAITTDAASGIDVKSAGALDIGNTVATSIEYGSAAVTVHTLVASGTGDAVVVLPLLSVGNGEINDVAATKLSGDIAVARMAEALKAPGAIGGTTPAAGAFTTVDANSYTANVGSGIDAQAAGALDIGNTTATSIDYGSSAVTAHTFTSDGTGDTEFVVPDGSISATELVTAVQTSLGLADTAAQAADVWGAPTATPSPTLLVNAVTIQAKTAAGGDLSEFRLIRVWTSETSMGAASTNNIETLVLSTGTAVDTVVAHADYRYVTATDGSALATITGTATGTNYVMVSDGSSVSATAITFIP